MSGEEEPANRVPGALARVRDVAVAYGHRRVLDGVHLEAVPGRITTLVGNNGAGKSTLLRVILGLTAPTAGRVEWASGLRIGYVPQQFSVEAHLPITVRRFISLVGPVDAQRWRAAVADTGVRDLLEQPLQDLSGGETRRVLLARALLRRPALLGLDEPAAGLDVRSQGALYRLIGALRDRYGCGVVVVSHDLNLVMASSDEVLCLENGRIACHGAPASVMEHPEYQKLFGVHAGPEVGVFPHDHPEAGGQPLEDGGADDR